MDAAAIDALFARTEPVATPVTTAVGRSILGEPSRPTEWFVDRLTWDALCREAAALREAAKLPPLKSLPGAPMVAYMCGIPVKIREPDGGTSG